MGQAYAFFNCYEPKKEIEAELPTIRKRAQVPNDLELLLTESILLVPDGLLPIARNAVNNGLHYLLHATHPKATNKATADYLAQVLNQAYQSPLYQEGEAFEGGVVYKGKDSEYIFRK